MKDPIKWGQALRAARMARGLSLQAAADHHSLSDTCLENWEAGKVRNPREYLWRPLITRWPEVKAP